MQTNRRRFLSTAALAGAFSLTPAALRAASPNGDLRVAIIGFRSRGKGLANQLIGSKNAKLVALCDVDSQVMNAYADELDKKNIKVAKYDDYRKLCEAKDIDAVIIATPNHTHALIAATAAAHGKHSYVEKPVSHNVWEGRQIAIAAEKNNVIIQHGFQRRSETAWHEAYDFVKSGEIGELKLVRGFCYKRRDSIGQVGTPVAAPSHVNYDLWAGPRDPKPVNRKQFHYDWHWQLDCGNGDLGNQGPHQLDVCRWFLGDPTLPKSVLSVGARLGYEDDGEWANTQICYFDYQPVPVIFEVRGLKTEKHRGTDVGNIIDCEGGYLVGGHGPGCTAFDADGKQLKSFRGGSSHMQHFVDACHAGKLAPTHNAENGHLSSALAHIGNISWLTGAEAKPSEIKDAIKNSDFSEALDRTLSHLDNNGVDPAKNLLTLGKNLSFDAATEKFTGTHADLANPHLKGSYRSGFELPA